MIPIRISHLVGAIFLMLNINACAQPSTDEEHIRINHTPTPGRPTPGADSTRLESIAPILESLVGERVTVRGYLKNFAPALILVVDESSNVFADPAIVIIDMRLRSSNYDRDEFTDESSAIASLGCRDKYVEITGYVGFIEVQKVYGIVQIQSISVFDDKYFSGSGVHCY